jgi:hypothetical protein
MIPDPFPAAKNTDAAPAGRRRWRTVIRRAAVVLGLVCALLAVDGRMAAMIR